MNVFDATLKRLEYIFEEFDRVYFSFSGGKDSGLMVQLANLVAERLEKRFDLLILNIEANYIATVNFIKRIEHLSRVKNVYHFCLPFLKITIPAFSSLNGKCGIQTKKKNGYIHFLLIP